MSGGALAWTAVTNSLRSKTRTLLTVIAIVIGAFTLTLTTGVGNGITSYIDSTTASISGSSTLTVTKTVDDNGDEPDRYTGAVTTTSTQGAPGTVEALTSSDLTTIRAIDGVVSAEPVLTVKPDYVVYDGSQKYQLQTSTYVEGQTLTLVAGEQPDPDSTTKQIALPESFLDPLDLDDADDAIGETVSIGITDANDKTTTIKAEVVAVTQSTLANSDTASVNDALATALYNRQSVGLSTSDKESYSSATVEFDSAASDADVTTLKDNLTDAGYTGETVDDQIGAFKTVIDAITWVLNAFAIIALVAAGFGIVNTLLMSVKERTREIGLMKAMGLGGGNIFAMFSLEAVFIGFLGSLVGAVGAVVVGSVVNGVLSGGVLAGLPGLTLISFAPATILGIMALVMGIAFVAGSIPALRAARQDPIESLRYE